MPKYQLRQNGDQPQVQDPTLEEWLRAASDASLGDWFEGIGELDSPVQVETLRVVAQVILNCLKISVENTGDNKFFEFTRSLESFLTGWRIPPEALSESSLVFQNDKGVCFEASLVLGDTVVFQPRLTEEQKMALRSDFKLPRMQANLSRDPELVCAGMRMGFLRDMELLSTLISMWEKKAVKSR